MRLAAFCAKIPVAGACPATVQRTGIVQENIMIELKVTGMSCQHCVGAVTRAVHEVDAAAAVNVDLAAGRVTIDSTGAVALFRVAIEDVGYEVAA
jgi:copper chaperone